MESVTARCSGSLECDAQQSASSFGSRPNRSAAPSATSGHRLERFGRRPPVRHQVGITRFGDQPTLGIDDGNRDPVHRFHQLTTRGFDMEVGHGAKTKRAGCRVQGAGEAVNAVQHRIKHRVSYCSAPCTLHPVPCTSAPRTLHVAFPDPRCSLPRTPTAVSLHVSLHPPERGTSGPMRPTAFGIFACCAAGLLGPGVALHPARRSQSSPGRAPDRPGRHRRSFPLHPALSPSGSSPGDRARPIHWAGVTRCS